MESQNKLRVVSRLSNNDLNYFISYWTLLTTEEIGLDGIMKDLSR